MNLLVSVVIPVRDAEHHLPSCLEQLRQQDYPHDRLEVIVVDGLSRDATVQIAESYDLGRISRRIVCCPSIGRSQGMNAGIRAARGEAICRLDARTRIDSNYISLCVQTLQATGAANVGGLQVPEGDLPTQKAIGLAMTHPFGVGNAQFRIATTSGYVDTVYLGFFRRAIFEKVGYFDEQANIISEDSDLNQRIRAAGERIYLNTALRARYHPRESLCSQFLLYFRYGGARGGNMRKHGNLTSVRQIAAPGLIAAIVLLPVAGWWTSLAWYVWLAIILAYLLTNLGVSAALARKNRRYDLLPHLLATFPCMHFGFGLGFWCIMLIPERPNKPWSG
jgi:succinoglycan biosynthesis protein ExoA